MVPLMVIVPLFVRVNGNGNCNVSPGLIIRVVPALIIEFALSVQAPVGARRVEFCNWSRKICTGVDVGLGMHMHPSSRWLNAMPYFFVLLPSIAGTDWVSVRYGPRPLMRAKYRAYDPCLMSTPCPAAEQDPGRSRVTDVFVELAPWLGTLRIT